MNNRGNYGIPQNSPRPHRTRPPQPFPDRRYVKPQQQRSRVGRNIPQSVTNFISTKGYQLVRDQPFGQSGFGSVYLVRNKRSERDEAMKVVASTLKNLILMANDIEIMREFSGRGNIVIYNDFNMIENGTIMIIFMPYYHNGSVETFKRTRSLFSLVEIQLYSKQLMVALEVIHSRQRVHRNIKASNVLVDDNLDLRIGDFGLFVDGILSGVPGPHAGGDHRYMPPEAVQYYIQDNSGDVWGVGTVIIYMMFYGQECRQILMNNTPDVISEIFRNSPYYQDGRLVDFVQLMFMDYEHRPTSDQLINHPWITSCAMNSHTEIDNYHRPIFTAEPMILDRGRPHYSTFNCVCGRTHCQFHSCVLVFIYLSLVPTIFSFLSYFLRGDSCPSKVAMILLIYCSVFALSIATSLVILKKKDECNENQSMAIFSIFGISIIGIASYGISNVANVKGCGPIFVMGYYIGFFVSSPVIVMFYFILLSMIIISWCYPQQFDDTTSPSQPLTQPLINPLLRN